MEYEVDFYFVYPIINMWDAQDCLNTFEPALPKKVKSFDMEIKDENGGKIRITSEEALTPIEQSDIQDTLRKEFRNGFGLIFENQPFATRFKCGFVEGALFPEEDFEVSSIRSKDDFKLREITKE